MQYEGFSPQKGKEAQIVVKVDVGKVQWWNGRPVICSFLRSTAEGGSQQANHLKGSEKDASCRTFRLALDP